MAFFAWQNQRDRQTQAEAARLAEIEARKQAELALQANLVEQERKQLDVTKVADAEQIIKSFQQVAMSEDPLLSAQDARRRAEYQYAQFVSSQPQAVANEAFASSAINRNKRAMAEGAFPMAGVIGRAGGEADLAGLDADRREGMLRSSVARSRIPTAGPAAAAADAATRATGNLQAAMGEGTMPFAAETAETQAKAGIAANRGAAAQSAYETAALPDPQLGRQAANAGFAAARDQAAATSAMGGIQIPDMFIAEMLNDPQVMQAISSALRSRVTGARPVAPAAVQGTNTVQQRLLNINQLSDPRFKRQY